MKCDHEFCVDVACGKCGVMLSKFVKDQTKEIKELDAENQKLSSEVNNLTKTILNLRETLDLFKKGYYS